VAAPGYRLFPQAAFPEFVEDCAAAVAQVRRMLSQLGGRHRLFVGGHSAGAFNAAMLAADRHYLADVGVPADAVAGYVLLSGPYAMSWMNMPSPYSEIFPAATRAGANVVSFIDGREPPMLLMTVDADSVVGMRDVYQLADTVKAKGGRATLAVYRGSSDHLATFYGLSEPGSTVRKDLAAFIASVSGP
jgi:acetyl esterase/lipase